MTLPAIDDVAALHDRMDAWEKQQDIAFEHHRVLATQIAELATNINKLTRENTELRQSMNDMQQRIPQLMAEGIAAAVGNPATWAAAREAMRRQAQQAAGGWLLGGLRFVLDKCLWAGLALLAVYLLGGWPALATALKLKASGA